MAQKIRAFVINRADRRSVAGAPVLVAVCDIDAGGKPAAAHIRLAAAASDHAGYVSIDLTAALDAALLRRALVRGVDSGDIDVTVGIDGDADSQMGLLAAHGLLKAPEVLAKLVADASAGTTEQRVERLIQHLFGSAKALTLETLRSAASRARPGKVMSPDTLDYQVSPDSFIERDPLVLGADGCEHIVPATLPLLVYPLVRLNVRAPLAEQGNGGKGLGTRGEPPASPVTYTELAEVDGPLGPDSRILWAEALHFEQRVESLGHALGEIKYSLALAPGEAVRIAVVDWSRQDTQSRADTIREKEQLLHEQTLDRDVDEIVTGRVAEKQGGFSAMMGNAGAVDFSIPQYGISGAGRHAMGWGGSFSQGDRDMRADSQQDIHNAVVQRSNSQRSLTSTVVIQAGQAEQNYLATRIVANMNRGHALTIQYYEVLRHLRLRTEYRKRDWAILVPFQTFEFTDARARRFRAQLEPALLDGRLAGGFAALERAAVGDDAYAPPPASGNEGGGSGGETQPRAPVLSLSSYTLTLRSGPGQDDDTWGSVAVFARLKSGARLQLFSKDFGSNHAFKGRSDSRQEDGYTVTAISRSDPLFDPTQLDALEVRWKVSQNLGEKDFDGWDLDRVKLTGLVGGYADGPREHVFLDWQSIAKAGEITFPRPVDVAKDVDPIPNLNAGLIRSVNALMGNPVALDADDSKITHADALAVKRRYQSPPGAGGTQAQIASPAASLPPPASAPAPQPGTGEPEPGANPSKAEVFDKTRDAAAAKALVNHLNANQIYYNAQTWLRMDPRERRLRLRVALGPYFDGTGDEALAVYGNHIALPYFGPADFLPPLEAGSEPAPLESILTLPTRGVFAEAHLGHCNGAEQRDVTRLWNFDELPVSLLPNIEGLTPGPRGTAPNIAQPTLPANILNIVNSPSVPDPKGVTAATDLLGRSDLFRDMSGLKEVSAMLGKLIDAAKPPPIGAGAANTGDNAEVADQASAIKDKVDGMMNGGSGDSGKRPSATELYDAFRVGKEATQTMDGEGGGGAGAGGGGSAIDTLGQIVQAIGPAGGTASTAGGAAKRKLRKILIADSGGDIDLQQIMADALRAQARPTGNLFCIFDTLTRFAALCQKAGATISTVPDANGASYPIPDIGVFDAGGSLKLVNPRDFLALWSSDTAYRRWMQLPQESRGAGAPGALRYAGLTEGGRVVSGDGIWPALRPGAPLQFWVDNATYESVRDHPGGIASGHSAFLVERIDDDNATISDYMRLRRPLNIVNYVYNFVIGANLTKASLVSYSESEVVPDGGA